MASLTGVVGLAASWMAALGEASLRIAVLLCAAWLVCLALRRRSAALRHTIWAVSLAAVAAMPVLMNLSPTWRVRTPWPLAVRAAVSNDDVDVPFAAATADVHRRRDGRETRHAARSSSPDDAVAALDAGRAAVRLDPAAALDAAVLLDAPAPALVLGTRSKRARELPSVALVISGIWVIGFFVFLARVVIGNLRLRKLARGAAEAGDIEDLAGGFGVGRAVRFLNSATETMPMTWGWRKPVVVLPASFAKWDEWRRAMTVYHELAHVGRADWLTQTLAQVVSAFYWFHPLVWLALRRLRIEADCACDDRVLAAGVKPSGYAGHLVQAAREFRSAGLRPWVAIAMAHPSSLDRRVQYVLDENVERAGLGRFGKLAAALGVVAIVLMVPSVEAVGRTETSAKGSGVEPVLQSLNISIAELLPATAAQHLAAAQPDAALLAQAQAPAEQGSAGLVEPARKDAQVEMERALQQMTQARQAAKDRMDEFNYEFLKKAEGRQGPRLSPEAMQTAGAALRRALSSSDAKVRAEAAEALGNLGSFEEANLQALAAVLKDSEPQVQKNAVQSLGRLLRLDKDLPGDRAVGFLAAAVSSPDADLRREAAEALGRLRGAAAIGAATKLVDDADPQVQREAVESLGRLLHRSDAQEVKAALPVLRKALQAKDADVRRQVVETLGGLRSIADDVVPLLAQATEDPDPAVQREAVEALGKISSAGDFEDWSPEIEDAIEGAVEGVIEGTVEGTVDGTVEGGVKGGVVGGVGGAVKRTVGGAVEGTIKGAMRDAYQFMHKAEELRRSSGEI